MHAVEIETRWPKKDEQTTDGAFSHQEIDETHGKGSFFFFSFCRKIFCIASNPFARVFAVFRTESQLERGALVAQAILVADQVALSTSPKLGGQNGPLTKATLRSIGRAALDGLAHSLGGLGLLRRRHSGTQSVRAFLT